LALHDDRWRIHGLPTREGETKILLCKKASEFSHSLGPNRRFTVFVAEQAARIIGIAICGDRYFPGWIGPTLALLDLCVESHHRNRGVGTALLARVAEFAKARDCAMIELTMRSGNRAAALYERVGFAEVPEIRNYVIAGDALDRLAAAVPAPARMAG
jgi:ribosomal protein S18 acetylase RimI-like enzyme